MFDGEKPILMEKQSLYDDKEICVKVKAKLQRVIDSGYTGHHTALNW